ncbi:MAG TPA: ABC transporter permease [Vicinamibacteria bacterium]|jgi:phospholipid/cholesterol/gamma-HCH transport system permease protein
MAFPMAGRTRQLLRSLGRRLLTRFQQAVLGVQEYALLSWRGLSALTSRPRYTRDVIAQMDMLGVQSLSIVVLTGMFTGMVLALQSAASLDAFGARPYVGRLVCVSMVRELGPVLTALMITGRVGSGMAAELGSMVVTQQIDALRVLGTDPVRKLVAPRLAAGLVMVPVMTVISDTLGIFGGSLISIFNLKLSWEFYWRSVGNALVLNDLVMGLTKPVMFGFILASVGCYMGLTTKGGTQGVGKSTTRSVVVGSVLILSSDFFMTKLLLLIFPVK